MSDLNLPKGWAATQWQVRYGEAQIEVSRRWVERNTTGFHGCHKVLVVDWSIEMPSNSNWRKFDGVTSGTFDSAGDLASDLATAVVKCKAALTSASKDWAAVGKDLP